MMTLLGILRSTNYNGMCESGPTTIEKAKKDLKKSKENLNKSIEEGDKTLCSFISKMVYEKFGAHTTPADGVNVFE